MELVDLSFMACKVDTVVVVGDTWVADLVSRKRVSVSHMLIEELM